MNCIYIVVKNRAKERSWNGEILFSCRFVQSVILILMLLLCLQGKAQVKMPDMIVPSDTWGLIDVNNLYGGCMQFATNSDMLALDVQFLKKGMLLVVFDDELNTPGIQTKVYIFTPPVGIWDYATPFAIPSSNQGKTIKTAELEPYLSALNLGGAGVDAMTLSGIQSVIGKKTFDDSTWAMKGTGTGVTALASANSTAINYTLTLPGKDGILATTDVVTSTADGLMLSTDKTKLDAFTKVTSSVADAGKVLALNNTGTGTVWVTAVADNLGDHTATVNLKMNGYLINNDGGTNKGLSFADDGKATFGQDLTVNGNFYTPSDERLKTNIETLTHVLEKIDRMRGVRFEYKDQKKYVAGSKIGIIAQELQKNYPEMISEGNDGYLKVDYTQLAGMLIQAVKEQQDIIKRQRREMDELKSRMDLFQGQIQAILLKYQ